MSEPVGQLQTPIFEVAGLILANLDAVADDLAAGAFVVLDQDRVRVRSLPFRPED